MNLGSNEREGERKETYSVTFRTDKNKLYTVYVPEEIWDGLRTGDAVELTVSGGKVTKINDYELR